MTFAFSRNFGRTAFALTGALALAACGSSDDASEEAVADTVEIPADEAMADITAEPIVDENVAPAPARNTEEDTAADAAATADDVARAESAAERATAAAADVAAIAAGAAATTEQAAEDAADATEEAAEDATE